MKVLLVLLATLPPITTVATEDLTIVYQTKGKKTGIKTEYWSSLFYRSNDEVTKKDTLVDLASGTIYTINHKRERVEFLRHQDIGELLTKPYNEMKRLTEIANKRLQEGKAGIELTTQTHKPAVITIAGRQCELIRQETKSTFFEFTTEACVDATLPIPFSLDALQRLEAVYPQYKLEIPGVMTLDFSSLSLPKEVRLRSSFKMNPKGLFALATLGLASSESFQEAIEVKLGPIDKSQFALPVGYTMIDKAPEAREKLAEVLNKLHELPQE